MKILMFVTSSYLTLSLSLVHLVKEGSFVWIILSVIKSLKVGYDKDQFEDLIQEYVCKILEERRNSTLHRYNWAVHRPFCEDIEIPDNYFLHRVLTTVPRE